MVHYLLRCIRYYAKEHIVFLCVCSLACGVIAGSLLIGHSFKVSLSQLNTQRLGPYTHLITGGDRFFTDSLPGRISQEGLSAVGVLAVHGKLQSRAQGVNLTSKSVAVSVYGVPETFWDRHFTSMNGDAFIGYPLAEAYQWRNGDVLSIDFSPASSVNKASVLVSQESFPQRLSIKVGGILGPKQGAEFSTISSSFKPLNIFVPLKTLQQNLGHERKINHIYLAHKNQSGSTNNTLRQDITNAFTVEDYELYIDPINSDPKSHTYELRSPRVFIPGAITKKLTDKFNGEAVFSYLSTGIRSKMADTPYSVVAGVTPHYLKRHGVKPRFISNTQVILSQWTADDLGVTVGDSISLDYFDVNAAKALTANSSELTVGAIVPIDHPVFSPSLMADFPGISDAPHCRDWEVGFNMDLSRVRPKDEAYWETYKGTPKLLLSYDLAQTLWNNPFGNATAIRFKYDTGNTSLAQHQQALLKAISIDDANIQILPIRELISTGESGAMSIGGLLIGFSILLLAGCFVLQGVYVNLVLVRRHENHKRLHALGFSWHYIVRLLRYELLAISTLGCIAGMGLGVGLGNMAIEFLQVQWESMVGHIPVEFVFDANSLIIGGLVVATAISVVIWRATRIKRLMRIVKASNHHASRLPKWLQLKWLEHRVVGWGITLACAGLLVVNAAPEASFGIALLGLLGWLGVCSPSNASTPVGTIRQLSNRNTSLHPHRHLGILRLITFGTFLVITVFSHELFSDRTYDNIKAGHGGFEWYGKSNQGFYRSLRHQNGRDSLGVTEDEWQQFQWVEAKLLAGDDVSCVNMNVAQQPQILGIDNAALVGHFSFAQTLTPNSTSAHQSTDPWHLLLTPLPDGSIPVIADLNTILYSLKSSVGKSMLIHTPYGERRITFVAALQPSIFQDSILMGENAFTEAFPGESGIKCLLVRRKGEAHASSATMLTDVFGAYGFRWQTSHSILNRFYASQNTYIRLFQALSFMGLLLAIAGLGLVIIQTIIERKREYSSLYALGWGIGDIRKLVWVEYGQTFLSGLSGACIFALLAVLPTRLHQHISFPWAITVVCIIGMLALGAGIIWLQLAKLGKTSLILGLRQE